MRYREATVSEHRSEERARSGASVEPSSGYREATVSEHRSEERARSAVNVKPSNGYREAAGGDAW